jgi:CheY-like chemotaxis protein
MKSLLIVEDCEEFRRMIVSMLRAYYDEIYECTDGKDAKAAYAKYKPDWVLMDIEMKEMDGLTATKKIKTTYPEARVVIMTQYQDKEVEIEAQLVGAEKFVLKDNIVDIKKIWKVSKIKSRA